MRAPPVPKDLAFWVVAYTLCMVLMAGNIPTPLYVIYQDL